MVFGIGRIAHNGGGMKRCRLRAISYQVTQKLKRATKAKITHYHGYYFYTLCVP